MKSRLLEVENYFIHLNDLLKTQASNGFKLTAIYDFLNFLLEGENYSKFISYFSDLTPYIENLIIEKNFEGLSPSLLTDFQLIIDKLSKFNLFKNKLELLKILEEGKKHIFNPVEKNLIPDCIPIVLIEENSNQGFRFNPKFAVIRKLYLETSTNNKKQTEDKIEFRNLIDLRESGIVNSLVDSVRIAKELCKKKEINYHNYNFSFYFDKDEYIYSGSSLSLAASSLVFNSILINEINNQYYKFRNDCVITGTLDKEGNLVKFQRDILELKIRGVFFSGYSKIVIPEENFVEAIEILKNLNFLYPEKKLEIIPIKKFENVFTNLEVVERFDLSFFEKLKANYKKYNVVLNWVLSVLLFLFIIFIALNFIVPRLDKNPVEYNYIDNHYSLFNKYGIEIWKSKNLSDVNRLYYYDECNKDTRCLLVDANKDDVNELFYLIRDVDNNTDNRTIFCSNTDIKSFPLILPLRNLNYPNDPVDNIYYYLKGILLINCNADESDDILFWGVNEKLYPGIIGAVDFNGNIIAEYWNEGHFNVVKVFNLDDKGEKEIFAGGCNNRDSIECAALIVFDPYFITGSSPYTDPLSNHKKGIEKYYIIFPKSIVLKFTNRERNDVHDIRYYSTLNIISCWINEGKSNEDAAICYQFDKDMNLISIDCTDSFKRVYENLSEEKKLNLPNVKVYLNELKTKVKWWNGDWFENKPSINKHYLAAKNNQQ